MAESPLREAFVTRMDLELQGSNGWKGLHNGGSQYEDGRNGYLGHADANKIASPSPRGLVTCVRLMGVKESDYCGFIADVIESVSQKGDV